VHTLARIFKFEKHSAETGIVFFRKASTMKGSAIAFTGVLAGLTVSLVMVKAYSLGPWRSVLSLLVLWPVLLATVYNLLRWINPKLIRTFARMQLEKDQKEVGRMIVCALLEKVAIDPPVEHDDLIKMSAWKSFDRHLKDLKRRSNVI
jgi:hypothetical protein